MTGTPSLAEQRTGQGQGLGRWSLGYRSEMVIISGFLRFLDWILTGCSRFESVPGRRLRTFDLASRRAVFKMCRVCYTDGSRPELFGHAAGRVPSSGNLRNMARLDYSETCDCLGRNLTSRQETEQTGP
jgi:hypothetical protein